jgi:hypothetical protein
VDDAHAGGCGALVVAVGAVTDEQHLAGEVDVVGAGVDAGLDEREAAAGIGAGRRCYEAGRAGERRE